MKLLDRLFSVIERLTCSLSCCTQDVKVKVTSPRKVVRSPKKRWTA